MNSRYAFLFPPCGTLPPALPCSHHPPHAPSNLIPIYDFLVQAEQARKEMRAIVTQLESKVLAAREEEQAAFQAEVARIRERSASDLRQLEGQWRSKMGAMDAANAETLQSQQRAHTAELKRLIAENAAVRRAQVRETLSERERAKLGGRWDGVQGAVADADRENWMWIENVINAKNKFEPARNGTGCVGDWYDCCLTGGAPCQRGLHRCIIRRAILRD